MSPIGGWGVSTPPPQRGGQSLGDKSPKKFPSLNSRCSFSMMVKRANDGLLQANDGKMLVNDGEMLGNEDEMSIA